MKNTHYNILFAVDSEYVPHLATALYSLLINNKSLQFDIFIFTSSLSIKDESNLKKICNQYKASLKIIFIDDTIFEGLILLKHFTTSTYYRLLAADYIKGDKCLYLDTDIIVNGSIEKLYEKNIENYYLAAIEDPAFDRHKELGMKMDAKYFNSGVMLINLNKWRISDIKKAVLLFVKKKSSVLLYPDQCGLNNVINGNWIELGIEYNFQTSMLSNSFYKKNEIKINPIIIHYTGSSKPWHFMNKHIYKSNYWFYRNKTAYKTFLPDDLRFKIILKKIYKVIFK